MTGAHPKTKHQRKCIDCPRMIPARVNKKRCVDCQAEAIRKRQRARYQKETAKFELSPAERIAILTKRVSNLQVAYSQDQSGLTWKALTSTEAALQDAEDDLRRANKARA